MFRTIARYEAELYWLLAAVFIVAVLETLLFGPSDKLTGLSQTLYMPVFMLGALYLVFGFQLVFNPLFGVRATRAFAALFFWSGLVVALVGVVIFPISPAAIGPGNSVASSFAALALGAFRFWKKDGWPDIAQAADAE